MYNVYFLEHRTILLNQLRKSIPADGEELKIKGRKAKVLSSQDAGEDRVYVQVSLEPVIKKAAADLSKKKKR